MRFAATALASAEASKLLDAVANPIVDDLRERLTAVATGTELKGIVWAPIIVSASLGAVPESSEFERPSGLLMLCRNISYDSWMSADAPARSRLYCDSLRAAIVACDCSQLSPTVATSIVEAIDAAATHVGKARPST